MWGSHFPYKRQSGEERGGSRGRVSGRDRLGGQWSDLHWEERQTQGHEQKRKFRKSHKTLMDVLECCRFQHEVMFVGSVFPMPKRQCSLPKKLIQGSRGRSHVLRTHVREGEEKTMGSP